MIFPRRPKREPKPAPPPPFAGRRSERIWFRRGLGFTIKATIEEPEAIRIMVKRHGGDEREREVTRADLRPLMALNTFREWPADEAWLIAREAQDLIYWSDAPTSRGTTGAPLAEGRATQGKIALRDGVAILVATTDEFQQIVPWGFMPRRGALEPKRMHGARFSSNELRVEAYALDLFGNEHAVRVLRRLLPWLDGRASWAELEARFSGAEHRLAKNILEWLDDAACLELAPAKTCFDREGPWVAWLGHACVLVRVGEATVLVDPLMMRRSVPPAPFLDNPFDWRLLPERIDACLITHADNDHLNPHTLVRLDRETPMIVPAPVVDRPYQVDIDEVLRFIDFSQVRHVSPWESVKVGDTVITGVPFMGEDWGLELAKATYVISGPKGRVYVGADSFNDSAVHARVAKDLGPIDFAFLGISGCEEPLVAPPGFGYGEFYALWLPRARRNQWIRHTQGPLEAAEAARVLGAKNVFGYAAGGGSFMDMSHSDRGTHSALCSVLADQGLAHLAKTLELGVPYNF